MNAQPLHHSRGKKQHLRGYTLIEVLITAAVLGVVGSVAVISARSILPGMWMDRASSRLAFHLQWARSEAIANNQNVFIRLDTAENTLWIWVDHNRDGEIEAHEVRTVLLEEPERVSLASSLSEGLFNAYGQFITTPGQRRMETTQVAITPIGHPHRSATLVLRGSGAITQR